MNNSFWYSIMTTAIITIIVLFVIAGCWVKAKHRPVYSRTTYEITSQEFQSAIISAMSWMEESRIIKEKNADIAKIAQILVFIENYLMKYVGHILVKNLDANFTIKYESKQGDQFLKRLYHAHHQFMYGFDTVNKRSEKKQCMEMYCLVADQGIYSVIFNLAMAMYGSISTYSEKDYRSILRKIDSKDVQRYIIHLNKVLDEQKSAGHPVAAPSPEREEQGG